MREIKFRAWNKQKQVFIDGLFVTGLLPVLSPFSRMNAPEFVVEQFTGLKDKNGREIYEGDIIRTEYGLDVATMERFPKFWLKKESLGYKGEKLQDPEFCEVVGSIYENPEILEDKK